jgi:hypothetical protein
MPISFLKLVEMMDNLPQEEEKGLEAIKAGLNISPDFWENFINITANAEAMADLLEVPQHKVASWGQKIRTSLEKVGNTGDTGEKSEVLPTGQQTSGEDHENV